MQPTIKIFNDFHDKKRGIEFNRIQKLYNKKEEVVLESKNQPKTSLILIDISSSFRHEPNPEPKPTKNITKRSPKMER